ncbi:MAG: 50S ribosomal protein L15 [candidate division WOR-3 bacterium]
MLKLSSLKPPKGATKKRKRVGCGPGSGHGKTSGRGHKGAKARSGKEFDSRFEGGQTPFYRRIPKRGFKNPFRKEYEIVNLSALKKLGEKEITPQLLKARNLVKEGKLVKILGEGEIDFPIIVSAHAFSQSAKEKIEKAGGKVIIIK